MAVFFGAAVGHFIGRSGRTEAEREAAQGAGHSDRLRIDGRSGHRRHHRRHPAAAPDRRGHALGGRAARFRNRRRGVRRLVRGHRRPTAQRGRAGGVGRGLLLPGKGRCSLAARGGTRHERRYSLDVTRSTFGSSGKACGWGSRRARSRSRSRNSAAAISGLRGIARGHLRVVHGVNGHSWRGGRCQGRNAAGLGVVNP